MKILVGDHNISQAGDTMYEAQYDILSVRVNEYYNKDSILNYYDIALVGTTSMIKYNRGVGPACIPPAIWAAATFFDSKSLEAVGWGTTE
jgi:hypothetical protein